MKMWTNYLGEPTKLTVKKTHKADELLCYYPAIGWVKAYRKFIYKTWDEAHRQIVRDANYLANRKRREYKSAMRFVAKLEAMKKPEGA